MDHVVFVDLYRNNLSACPELGGLGNLHTLYVAANPFAELHRGCFANLSRLERLDVTVRSDVRGLGGTCVVQNESRVLAGDAFAELPALREVWLSVRIANASRMWSLPNPSNVTVHGACTGGKPPLFNENDW